MQCISGFGIPELLRRTRHFLLWRWPWPCQLSYRLPTRDGQAEWASTASYIARRYIFTKAITKLTNNRGQRSVTSLFKNSEFSVSQAGPTFVALNQN